ncbi:MAG: hypothetical protein GY869_13980, partial [Planctomycetes bacterium]|nr:hypothetical protein [Planctomycetota bacterium]
DLVEHSITGATINVTTSDAYVVIGSDPATAFTSVTMTQPNPAVTNDVDVILDFQVNMHQVLEVSQVDLSVVTPAGATFPAGTITYDPGIGNSVTDSFDYEIVFSADGLYTFYIVAYNICGLASDPSNEVTVCLDRGVPEPTLALDPETPIILNLANSTVLVTMTENPNDPDPTCGPTTPTIHVLTPGAAAYVSNPGATWNFDATATGSGTYCFYGRVVDAAGNVDSTDVACIEADLDAPLVSWLDLIDGYDGNDCYPPESDFTNIDMVKASVITPSDDVVTLNFDGDLALPRTYNYVPGAEYNLILNTDIF